MALIVFLVAHVYWCIDINFYMFGTGSLSHFKYDRDEI